MPAATPISESGWFVPPMAWRDDAACLDEDPELFFPIGNKEPAALQVQEAKAVCARCDVRESCLTWALENDEDHGVWGGLDEEERRARRRSRRRAGQTLAA